MSVRRGSVQVMSSSQAKQNKIFSLVQDTIKISLDLKRYKDQEQVIKGQIVLDYDQVFLEQQLKQIYGIVEKDSKESLIYLGFLFGSHTFQLEQKKSIIKCVKVESIQKSHSHLQEFDFGRVLCFQGEYSKICKYLKLLQVKIWKSDLQDEKQQQQQNKCDLIFAVEIDYFSNSLEKLIQQRIEENISLGDEEFREICKNLIQMVCECHDANKLLLFLQPEKIVFQRGNYYVVDFWESREIKIDLNQMKQQKENSDTILFDFSLDPQQISQLKYCSPELKKQLNSQKFQEKETLKIQLDWFKNDVYVLGMIIMRMVLQRQKLRLEELDEAVFNSEALFKKSIKNSQNKYILNQDDFYIKIEEQRPQSYEIINLIQSMLDLDLPDRISSLKLAFITKQPCLLKFVYLPFYREKQPPYFINTDPINQNDNLTNQNQIQNQIGTVTYPLSNFSYNGMVVEEVKRQGQGQMIRNDNEIIFDGNWHNDFPEGQGKYKVFGQFWYEGQFRAGNFIDKGTIKINGINVFQGQWQSFMLLDEKWLKKISSNQQLEVDGKYIIRQINMNEIGRELLVKYDQDTILAGEEFLIRQTDKSLVVDDHYFDLFLQIVQNIRIINLKFFDEKSIQKFTHLLPSNHDFQNISVMKIQLNNSIYTDLLVSFLSSNNASNLKELDLSFSADLSFRDNAVAMVLSSNDNKLKNLIKIRLQKTKENLHRFLWQLSLGQLLQSQIEEIDLQESSIDNKTLEILFQCRQLKKLKRISLKNCLKITSEAINNIAQYLVNIKYVEDFDISSLLHHSPNTAFFGDLNIDAFKKFMPGIQALKGLRNLILDNSNINDTIVELIAKLELKNLKRLSLRYCQKVTYKGVFYLQVAAYLTSLEEILIDYSSSSLPKPTIERWKNIYLSCTSCKSIDSPNLSEYLKACQQVKQINISGSMLNLEVIGAINKSKIQILGILIEKFEEVGLTIAFFNYLQNQNLKIEIFSQEEELILNLNNEIITGFNKKSLPSWVTQNISIKGKSYEEFYQQFLKRPQQISNKQIISQSQFLDEKQLFSATKASLDNDLYKLINSQRKIPITNLNLTKLKIKNQQVSIITNSLQVLQLNSLDLSFTKITQKALRKIASTNRLSQLNEIILEGLENPIYQGIDDLISSQNLSSLKIVKLGLCNLDNILKILLQSNKQIILPLYEEQYYKLNYDYLQIEVTNKFIKNSKIVFYVLRGIKQQSPSFGIIGEVKIKLNTFIRIRISNQIEFKNTALAIYEIIRYSKVNLEKKLTTENQNFSDSVKMSLIGQPLSGKKSLALKWCHNLSFYEMYQQSVGQLYFKKDIKLSQANSTSMQNIIVNIWYLSTRPQYINLTRFQCSDSDSICVLFDLTSPNAFEEIANIINQMQGYQYEKIITVIGNKADQVDKIQREQAEKIENLANSLELGYYEISTHESKNLKDILVSIVEDSYKQKNQKPEFSGENLLNLGLSLNSITLSHVYLKIDLQKAKQKFQIPIMKEFCNKLSSSNNLNFTDLNLKNWKPTQDDEISNIASYESSRLKIQFNYSKERKESQSIEKIDQSKQQLEI